MLGMRGAGSRYCKLPTETESVHVFFQLHGEYDDSSNNDSSTKTGDDVQYDRSFIIVFGIIIVIVIVSFCSAGTEFPDERVCPSLH